MKIFNVQFIIFYLFLICIYLQMYLEEKEVKIVYSLIEIFFFIFVEKIFDLGFLFKIKLVYSVRGDNCQDVIINVEGMICQLCVKFIEFKIFEVSGVLGIIVLLEKKQVYVQFNFGKVFVENIVVVIDNMGFEVSVYLITRDKGLIIKIGVEGMIC